MRLYTGKGDQGSTDLLGERVQKDDPRIELIGTLDESTSSIGFARALAGDGEVNALALQVQRDLYRIMAELAFTDEMRPEAYRFPAARADWLTVETDRFSAAVELPPQFIVPGETVASAAFDVARTVVRRAERQAVHLARAGQFENPDILRYLNRLSSLLFLAARLVETRSGVAAPKAKA